MYKFLIAAVLSLALPSAALAQETEVHAAPNLVVKQVTTGCLIGGSAGAVVGAMGLGLGSLPSAIVGCGVGGAVAPTASHLYDRYKVETFLAFDDAVTYAYGWWQEQKLKDFAN